MSTIKLRRSATSGNVPTTAQLALGELAINTYDGKLYLKKDDGTASIVDVTDTDIVQDTTPQLGGDLDLNSSDITGTGNIDITGTITSGGLAVDTNTLFVDSTNNRVGIGTTAPIVPLQVVGTGFNTYGNIYLPFAATQDTTNYRGVYLGYSSNEQRGWVIGSGTSSNLTLGTYTSGNVPTAALSIDSSQNVGIGTTSPDSKLHTKGDGVQLVYFESGDGDAVQVRLRSDSENRRIIALNNADQVKTQLIFEDNAIVFAGTTTPGDQWVTVSSGNVGIGTSSPNSPLEVVSGSNPVVSVRSTAAAGFSSVEARQDDYLSGPSYGNVYIRRYNDSATGTFIGVSTANLAAVGALNSANFVIGTNGNAPIIFSAASTERMRITNSGNVGIGTSSPGYTLESAGTVAVKNTNPTLKIIDTNGTSTHSIVDESVNNDIWYHSTRTSADVFAGFNYLMGLGASGATIHRWYIDGSEKARLNTNGLGIGTNNPTATLDVVGDAQINALTVGRGGSGNNTNTALGRLALDSNVSGVSNTAIGNTALQNNTGTANTAVGANAMLNNTASNNVALGASAMISNTTGTQNTALGRQALFSNTTANSNTAVGYQSLYSNTTGAYNTATGSQALYSNTTGNNNTATGLQALQANTTGQNNTATGYKAGDVITTGARNTIVGVTCDPSAADGNDQVVVGFGLTGKGNETAFIGGTNGAYNEKNVTTWETTSDERIKKNITDNNDGLSVLSQIQVRNFEYRTPEEITDLPSHAAIEQDGVQLGVIAQEIQQVLPECVSENSTGVLSVSTDPLVWYLINAVKELKAEIDTLKGN